jgi:hypothetical protein
MAMLDAGRFFAEVVGSRPFHAAATTLGASTPDGVSEPLDQEPPTTSTEPEEREFLEQVDVGRAEWRETASSGWDVIAYYAPYHSWGPEQWGITFVTERFVELLRDVVDRLDDQGPAVRPSTVAGWLREALMAHELFHFQVEWAATVSESFIGHSGLFDHYFDSRRGTHGLTPTAELEEALATAAEIETAQSMSQPLGALLADDSVAGPPGYCDFEAVLSRADRVAGWQQLLDAAFGKCSSPELLEPDLVEPYRESVPVYRRDLGPFGTDVPEWVLPRLPRLTLAAVLRHARRLARHGLPITIGTGSKHPEYIELNGTKVPLSPKWDRIPDHVVRDLAALFGMSGPDYRWAVVGR